MKLTAIILTKNEEKNIEKAIKSVSFCDEILIIDEVSTDKTVELAKKLNITVYEHNSKNDFAKQRNWAMEKAKYDWILFLDADEEVTEDLRLEINDRLLAQADTSAFYIKRRDFWWGREMRYGEVLKTRNTGLIRLVQKNEGVWVGQVHERFIPTKNTTSLSSFINHYPHPTLKEFISDINHYSTLRAQELKEQDVKFSLFSLVTFPFGKFILNYFLYLGFLDGAAGFAYAFLMSFHSFLVRAKLYQYTKIDNKE